LLDYDVTSEGQRFLVRVEDLSAGEGLRVAIDGAP
jgi:hypothetical protein